MAEEKPEIGYTDNVGLKSGRISFAWESGRPPNVICHFNDHSCLLDWGNAKWGQVFLGSSCHFHRKVKGIQESRTTECDVGRSPSWKAQEKKNYNSQNSHIETLNITQGLFMTKLEESFICCCKVTQNSIYRILATELSIEFTAIVLGMVLFLGIYRRFGKPWSTLNLGDQCYWASSASLPLPIRPSFLP